MRTSIRWALTILPVGLALAAVAGWFGVRPYVRATSLVVRSAGLADEHPTLASWQRRAFAERGLTMPGRRGTLYARMYVPDRRVQRTVMLVHGVNAMAIDEPRLVSFARELAATGFTVITPVIPDLKRYAVTPRATDAIEDAAAWLAAENTLTRSDRIGIIGISFAGGLSIVAAGRQSIADRVAFVLSFGGHGDFQRVVRYLCTGIEPSPSTGVPAGDTSRRGSGQVERARRRPHDYGVAVMVLDLADRIVPPEQVEPLRRSVLVFLEASHLALFDAKSAERAFATARELEWTLPEPSASYLHLVNTRNIDLLGSRLLPFIGALGDDPALSPEQSQPPRAPVYLLHGADDNVVPAVESRLLAEHLAARTPVRLLLSPLITHAEVNKRAGPSQLWQLVSFWASVLRQ